MSTTDWPLYEIFAISVYLSSLKIRAKVITPISEFLIILLENVASYVLPINEITVFSSELCSTLIPLTGNVSALRRLIFSWNVLNIV